MANGKCGHITAAHVKYVILHISGTLKYAQLRTFHYSKGLRVYSNSYVHSHVTVELAIILVLSCHLFIQCIMVVSVVGLFILNENAYVLQLILSA